MSYLFICVGIKCVKLLDQAYNYNIINDRYC
jgi:hypothetical protein